MLYTNREAEHEAAGQLSAVEARGRRVLVGENQW